jgi:hypothetical protein
MKINGGSFNGGGVHHHFPELREVNLPYKAM